MFDSMISTVGENYIIGKILDIRIKYGEGLSSGSLTSVSKVIADLSTGMTVSDITGEMRTFTYFLSSDNIERRRFFSYWKQLDTIISSYL